MDARLARHYLLAAALFPHLVAAALFPLLIAVLGAVLGAPATTVA